MTNKTQTTDAVDILHRRDSLAQLIQSNELLSSKRPRLGVEQLLVGRTPCEGRFGQSQIKSSIDDLIHSVRSSQ